MKHVKVERQLKSVEQQVFDIQDQKDSEVNYLHCQLSQLQEQLVKAHQPWWKKLFLS
jgi:flagellar capping protein FliD